MANDITEKLFQSIDTIVSKKLENLPYDKTLICKIEDTSKNQKNQYIVSNQNVKFIAYSDREDFKNEDSENYLTPGDYVYVQIPQGDFNQNKHILNRIQTGAAEYANSAPMERYVQVSRNINENYGTSEDENFFIINNVTKSKKIFSYEILSSKDSEFCGYNLLGIKLAIKANLYNRDWTAVSGGYRIKAVVNAVDLSNISANGPFQIGAQDYEYYIELTDMVTTSPYKTIGYCNWGLTFDISKLLIKKIDIYLEQTEDFMDVRGERIPPEAKIQIYTKDLIVSFGYDKDDLIADTVGLFLYTTDGWKYSNENHQKNLYVRYIRYINNQWENVTSAIPDLKRNYWGVYDEKAGYNANFEAYYIKTIDSNKNHITNTFDTTNNLEYQIINFVIYDSNLRKNITAQKTFINNSYLKDAGAIDIITGLSVSFTEDEWNGVYNIYGQDNLVLNKYESNKVHYLLVKYKSEISDRQLQPGDIITWHIPATNTMIAAPRDEDQKLGERELNEALGEYKITHEISNLDAGYIATDKSSIGFQVPFRIKDYYNQQWTNNTIKIEVNLSDNERSFETSQTLYFGTSGSEGSDYIFRLTLEKNGVQIPALTKGVITNTYIVPHLYDYNNTELTIDPTKINYTWLYNSAAVIGSKINSESYYRITELTYEPNTGDGLNALGKSILQAELELSNNIILKAYCPIASRDNSMYEDIEGASTVTYDITGKKPIYYKSKYNLKTKTAINYSWYLYSADDLPGYPQLNDNELIPASIYCNNLDFCYLYCKDNTNNKIAWVQPLLITQNKYPSAMWNGEANPLKLTNVDNSGIINTTMVGRVNQDNNGMSGMFIGILDDTTGLYGFQEGREIFRLDEKGRIHINGNVTPNSGVNIVPDIEECYIKNSVINTNQSITLTNNAKFIGDLQGKANSADSAIVAINYKNDSNENVSINNTIKSLQNTIANLQSTVVSLQQQIDALS